MVSLDSIFSQVFFGDFCMTGAIALIALLLGVLVSRLIWALSIRGQFGDE